MKKCPVCNIDISITEIRSSFPNKPHQNIGYIFCRECSTKLEIKKLDEIYVLVILAFLITLYMSIIQFLSPFGENIGFNKTLILLIAMMIPTMYILIMLSIKIKKAG